MAIALTDAAAKRSRIYRGFERRNRFVGYLRILVPGVGVIVFVLLAGQVVIANLAENFSIGRVSLQADRMVVETPSYSGVTNDGSIYKITALSAEVGLGAIDAITLNGATLVIDDAGGVQTTAKAARADLQTTDETVKVEGQTTFTTTAGTSGALQGMDLAFTGPVVTASGAVSFRFADGEQLDAANMHYDGTTGTWTFSKVTLTLPDTPRAPKP
jgi:lipopolysaccharide export system protein LptC